MKDMRAPALAAREAVDHRRCRAAGEPRDEVEGIRLRGAPRGPPLPWDIGAACTALREIPVRKLQSLTPASPILIVS